MDKGRKGKREAEMLVMTYTFVLTLMLKRYLKMKPLHHYLGQ